MRERSDRRQEPATPNGSDHRSGTGDTIPHPKQQEILANRRDEMKTELKNQVARAEELGRLAFENGDGAGAKQAELETMLDGPIGCKKHMVVLRAWNRGWTLANVAALWE